MKRLEVHQVLHGQVLLFAAHGCVVVRAHGRQCRQHFLASKDMAGHGSLAIAHKVIAVRITGHVSCIIPITINQSFTMGDDRSCPRRSAILLPQPISCPNCGGIPPQLDRTSAKRDTRTLVEKF